MPLRDHFHPPLKDYCPWSAFHSKWATKMVDRLNGGSELPTVPLWLKRDVAVPLELELTYAQACKSLRIG